MTLLSVVATPVVPAYLVSAAVALYAFERQRPALVRIFKPLTTLMLLGIASPPGSLFTGLVWAGIIASVGGDVALISGGDVAFLIGLGFFLVAHLAYVGAFLCHATWSGPSWLGVLLVAVATPLLLRALWPGVKGLRAPVVAYAAAISAMVIAAFSTLGGGLAGAPLAVAGAVLFYVSDATLALNRFVRPLPHPELLSVGVYWLGQLGIALASRSSAF